MYLVSTLYLVMFSLVGAALAAGFWLVLGVASRFRASGRQRRLAWASALGPLGIAVVLVVGEARAELPWGGLRTAGVFCVAAGFGGLVFWLVSRAVTRRVFHQENT